MKESIKPHLARTKHIPHTLTHNKAKPPYTHTHNTGTSHMLHNRGALCHCLPLTTQNCRPWIEDVNVKFDAWIAGALQNNSAIQRAHALMLWGRGLGSMQSVHILRWVTLWTILQHCYRIKHIGQFRRLLVWLTACHFSHQHLLFHYLRVTVFKIPNTTVHESITTLSRYVCTNVPTCSTSQQASVWWCSARAKCSYLNNLWVLMRLSNETILQGRRCCILGLAPSQMIVIGL